MAIHILNGVSMSPWWPRWHLGGVCLLYEVSSRSPDGQFAHVAGMVRK